MIHAWDWKGREYVISFTAELAGDDYELDIESVVCRNTGEIVDLPDVANYLQQVDQLDTYNEALIEISAELVDAWETKRLEEWTVRLEREAEHYG